MENKGIGVSNLPYVLHNEFRKKPCDLSIMLIGSHGLGKTTFMNQLIGQDVLPFQPFEEKETNPFWYLESKCNIQISSLDLIEKDFITRLKVFEIDCLGDHEDNSECFAPVVELIESKFNDFMNKFKTSTTRMIQDERIHICFYFLEPIASISEANIETLKRISQLCTIIPVIAKADMLSAEQVPQIKAMVRETFEMNSIPILKDHEFSDSWPFLIFSESRNGSDNEGKMWRDTAFQKIALSNFKMVKKVILERDAYQLIKHTNQFYDNYRINRLLANSTDKEIKEVRERIERRIGEYENEIKKIQARKSPQLV